MPKVYKMINTSAKQKILVVDDEPEICELLTLLLSQYEVLTAYSAAQAFAQVVDHDFNLIITDVRMPGASGFNLAELAELMAIDVPVLVVSGDASMESMQANSPRAVCVGFVGKPFTKDEITMAVENALRCGVNTPMAS